MVCRGSATLVAGTRLICEPRPGPSFPPDHTVICTRGQEEHSAIRGGSTVITLKPGSHFTSRPQTRRLDHRDAKVWNRRVSPIAARSDDGLLTEPEADTQPWRWELVFMPEAVEKRVTRRERPGAF